MDLFAQRNTIDKLHHDEVETFTFPDFINMRDVWVVQRGRSFCFLHKSTHPIRLCGELSWQKLYCNLAIELCILRQIDLTHTTRAEL
jgi:hypothetical protein